MVLPCSFCKIICSLTDFSNLSSYVVLLWWYSFLQPVQQLKTSPEVSHALPAANNRAAKGKKSLRSPSLSTQCIMKSFFQDSSQPFIMRWLYLCFSWLLSTGVTQNPAFQSAPVNDSIQSWMVLNSLSPALALPPALQLSEHTGWAVFFFSTWVFQVLDNHDWKNC